MKKKKHPKITAETFAPVTKHLQEHPQKKKKLAEYLTETLGEGKRTYRVHEVSRWLVADEKSEFYWAVGHYILDWYLKELDEGLEGEDEELEGEDGNMAIGGYT